MRITAFLYSLLINFVETSIRIFPIPTQTGCRRIGSPDRDSPVFLTCNYHLTVHRVKKALKGIDCYLLIADSKGINVWCAATGGHLNNHSVISVLKTSGIEKYVDHKKLILPQLAASGIEKKVIQKKTGWNVIWGPVYAEDIPAFIKAEFKKEPEMHQVKFPLIQRIEMAVMWAFPFSVLTSVIVAPLWLELLLTINILIWGLSLLIFISFPLYSKWLNPIKAGVKYSRYTIIFDFSKVIILFWGVSLVSIIIYSSVIDNFEWKFVLKWGIVSLVVVFLLSMDLLGSTPVFKSGLHEDRFLKIVINEEKCKGAGFCEEVCPRNCYEMNNEMNIITMPRADLCVQCGACIIQCTFDALYFENTEGNIIPPDNIRKFKLNMMGKRVMD